MPQFVKSATTVRMSNGALVLVDGRPRLGAVAGSGSANMATCIMPQWKPQPRVGVIPLTIGLGIRPPNWIEPTPEYIDRGTGGF